MKHRYKPLSKQTIVITGATSGIGLATAKRAARAGAKLVLSARNEEVLQSVCADINEAGGEAIYVVADVGNADEVQSIADTAIKEFGGFDTWVNNAGVVVFAKLDKLPIEDHAQVFKTNYWGVVHGSQTAVAHLRRKKHGGTLINVASINAEMPVPILGGYSASKAAVKAYSDVLRMELMEDGAPVKVAVIKPSGISTPISDHGRSHMKHRGKVMPPLYDAETVASTILAAAHRPVREITVGETGRLSEMFWHLFPTVADRAIGWALPRVQASGLPKLKRDNLYEAGDDGDVYLDGERQGIRFSPYTQARIYPARALGLGVLIAGATYAAMRAGQR